MKNSIDKRLTALEGIVAKHLQQSEGIITNIQWLTKAFWTLATGGITFNVMLAIAVITYVLNH